MKNRFSLVLIFVLLLSIPLFTACDISRYESPEGKDEEINKSAPVPPDGILETVTWNIEWFGDGIYGDSRNGPTNESKQLKNIVRVMDSLQADLYAFQEVYGQQALNDITQRLSGYKGFVADHIDWIQKTAFIYNTNTIDSLSAGPITNGQDSYAWAYGRFPLYFHFNYTYQNQSREFYAIVIHAKASADGESYQRRKQAAQDLYEYLVQQKPNANIIFLGDYNDDVDMSIFNNAPTPYQPFVADDANFHVVTKALSEAGRKSTVSYFDMIDHITISDELFDSYIGGSAAVASPQNFIPYYGNTTSDHYPVWAKFDMAE